MHHLSQAQIHALSHSFALLIGAIWVAIWLIGVAAFLYATFLSFRLPFVPARRRAYGIRALIGYAVFLAMLQLISSMPVITNHLLPPFLWLMGVRKQT